MADTLFTLDWLGRSAIGSFAILAATALVVRLCRQPADRVRIIGIGLTGAVLVPVLALNPNLPRWSLGVLPAEPTESIAADEAEASALQASIRSGPVEDTGITRMNIREAGKSRRAAKRSEVVTEPVREPIDAKQTSNPSSAEPLLPQMTPDAAPVSAAWSFSKLLLSLYGLATLGVMLWLLIGMLRLAHLWRQAKPASSDVHDLLREIAGPAAEGVRVLISPAIDAPIAFGGWRPVIVLPASASESAEALRYGLAHEWSHIERGDVWRWYLVALAQAVLFYQPLFWYLRRQVRLSQDFLADARSADHAAEPEDYAEFLVSLARRRLRVPGFALGITDRRSNLTWRVHMLLLSQSPLSRRCRMTWTLSATVMVFGLLFGLSAVRLTAATEPALNIADDEAKKPADPPKGETLNYSGKVTDKDTGKPIAGAAVVVRRSLLGDPTRKERNPVIQETKHTTDAEGKYSFTIPPEQTSERYLYIELDVEHPDYAAQKHFGYSLSMIRKNEKVGGRPFFESVELRPAKPVTGVVKTPDGKAAAGVKMMAYSVTSKRTDGGFEYGSFVDVKTDAEGKFRLPLTSPGWAVLWVLPEEYVPTTHVLNEKRGELGTFTLAAGPRLKGKVFDAKGKPVVGVIVNAESQDRNEEITQPVADNINRSAVTNERGEFEMKPLPPGNYLVKPGDYDRDASKESQNREKGEVPGVFIGTKTVLKASSDPEPVEVRAVPHVSIEAQHIDSRGKPTRGHAPFIFGRIDGTSWFGESKIDANGKVTAVVPHGLEDVQLDLMTNEHGVLRWRKGKDGPLNNNRRVMLGTINDDVKGIEIIKYTAPVVVVKVVAKDGGELKNVGVTALYGNDKQQLQGRFILGNGRQSDVNFEKQEDGRFRSMQMFPEEEAVVTGHADGYAPNTQKVKLAEGTTKDIEIVLEKTPPGKEGEKGGEVKR